MNKLLALMTAACIIFPLAGASCGKSPIVPQPIIIGTSLIESAIPIFVAENQGFFEQNGLAPTFKYYNTGAASVAGVLNGEADIEAISAEYVLVTQAVNAQSLQAVACSDKLDYVVILARKDHGISDISQLAGKKIGVVHGTALDFFLGRFLVMHSLVSAGVTQVGFDTQAHLNDALVSGSMDAIITASPYTEDAMKRLGDNEVSWPAQGNQAINVLAVGTASWINSNPAMVERFVRALSQAEDFIAQHPAEAKAIAKSKLNVSDDEIALIWARNQFNLSLDQSLVLAMEDQARWLIANNLTAAKEVSDFTDFIYLGAMQAVKPEAVNIIH